MKRLTLEWDNGKTETMMVEKVEEVGSANNPVLHIYTTKEPKPPHNASFLKKLHFYYLALYESPWKPTMTINMKRLKRHTLE